MISPEVRTWLIACVTLEKAMLKFTLTGSGPVRRAPLANTLPPRVLRQELGVPTAPLGRFGV